MIHRRVPVDENRQATVLVVLRILAAGRMLGVPELRMSVPAHVAGAGFGVLGDGDAVGNVAGALLSEPDVRNLLAQRHLVLGNHDLLAGCVVPVHHHRLVPARGVGQNARQLALGFEHVLLVDAQRSALARAVRIEGDGHVRRVVADQVLQDQGAIGAAVQKRHERLQIGLVQPHGKRFLDTAQVVALLKQIKKCPKILVCHEQTSRRHLRKRAA